MQRHALYNEMKCAPVWSLQIKKMKYNMMCDLSITIVGYFMESWEFMF